MQHLFDDTAHRQKEKEQALRDYKLTIEYKLLKENAPGGVFLVPSLNDLRLFYGFIIVRRGIYSNGIFKFQIRVPQGYNGDNTWPVVTFSSFVYNPHVNAQTGELSVKTAFPVWIPTKHFLVTILTHLKRIFYMKEYDDGDVANPEARDLAKANYAEYRKKVDACVQESQRSVYVNDPGSTAKLLKDKPCYRSFQKSLMKDVSDPSLISHSRVLQMIKEASKGK